MAQALHYRNEGSINRCENPTLRQLNAYWKFDFILVANETRPQVKFKRKTLRYVEGFAFY
jgi:hypothetical protein